MNRLYAVEGVYSLTGAMADHRLRLESHQIAAFVAALADAWARGRDRRECGRCRSHVGRSRREGSVGEPWQGLIVAGDRQPAAVHAAVCALNDASRQCRQDGQLLRAEGRGAPERRLARLARVAMKAGASRHWSILGGNPVFDAPADLDFAAAMAKVPTRLLWAMRSTRRPPSPNGTFLARTTSNRGGMCGRSVARSASSSR